MKKTLLALCMAVIALSCAAQTLTSETLNYKVSYKWGLVHKNAGTATLNLRVNGGTCHASVYGRTDSWADKFYKLRDTLTSTFSLATMMPTEYQRIAHEGGRYAHDIVKFTRQGDNVTGNCTRFRRGKGETEVKKSATVLNARGMTVDMLSAFYYLRTLDFASMAKGHATTVNIFSGKKKELLNITYVGPETIKYDGKSHATYHVRFTFTSDGRKKSSDPIDAWISTDSRHIPLKLEGSLKVGKIRCFYTGE